MKEEYLLDTVKTARHTWSKIHTQRKCWNTDWWNSFKETVLNNKHRLAYLIYNPHTEKVSKHRLVKFIQRNSIEQQIQTDDSEIQSNKAKNLCTESNTDMTQSDNEESLSTDHTDEPQCDETTKNVVLDEDSADPEPKILTIRENENPQNI